LGEYVIRLGLWCIFRDHPIRFANTTATAVSRMSRQDALAKLARLCTANAEALLASLRFCPDHAIGCFRINSQILPLRTHPQQGHDLADLPEADPGPVSDRAI
jgi:UV DNA damage endonuclease